MKIFVEGATKAQISQHAQAIIDGEKAKNKDTKIDLVKAVRLAKGLLLFFDRQEWKEWAKGKTVSKGVYSGEDVENTDQVA